MNNPIDKSIFNETGCIRKEQLLRYRDDLLASHDKHDVEKHLIDCVLCTEALEGLSLVTGTKTLENIQKELSQMTAPVPSANFRPLMAAAAMAGVVLLSWFAYNQFSKVNETQLVENNNHSALPEEMEQLVGTVDEIIDSGIIVSETLQPKIVTQQTNVTSANKVQTSLDVQKLMKEETSDAIMADEIESYSEKSKTLKLEIPVAASKDLTSTPMANGTGNQNITYVDNMKVIDYSLYDTDNIQLADVPRSTSSKYQNNKKKTEAAESEVATGMVMNRKADYLDLVADPVILFNNGRFESANSGFDELLKLNSKDQNAAFYKGLSLFNLKRYDKALELLVPISNDAASPFMEEAKYYSGKAYLNNGNVIQGKNVLNEIVIQNGFYAKPAVEELKNIKK